MAMKSDQLVQSTKPKKNSLHAWFLAARPKTLTIALIPFLAGPFLAYSLGASIDWAVMLMAILSAVCIQIGTNFINDAADFKKGADTGSRLGPMRAAQSGLLTMHQVYAGGMAFFLLALFFALPLMQHSGMIICIVLLISILCGYLYTAGPFPLAYVGLGEVFVILFFGFVSTIAACFLQIGRVESLSWLAGAQIGMFATVLLAINNLRDVREDSKAHKKTLAVRFGITFARIEVAAFALVPFLLNFLWIFAGYYQAALLPWLTLPLAVKLVARIWVNEPGPVYNQFFGLAGLLHLLFGLLLTLGFYLQ